MDNYLTYSIKLNELLNKYKENKEILLQQTHKSNMVRNDFLDINTTNHCGQIISELSYIINLLNKDKIETNIDLKDGESIASKIQRKPNTFDTVFNDKYVKIENEKKYISSIKNGYSTIKIRGSLEEGIEDSLEITVDDHGNGKNGSSFMIGLVPVSATIPNLSNPGKVFFGFSRDGELAQKGDALVGGTNGLSAGIFGTGDRVRFTVNPQTGYFSIHFNGELRLPGRLNIKEPMCFALGLQYIGQKVHITF